MLIEIISVPPGFAPEEIRQAWVGIRLPSLGRESDPLEADGMRFGNENRGGYRIEAPVAFRALENHNAEAHAWWVINFPVLLAMGELVFAANVCKEVD